MSTHANPQPANSNHLPRQMEPNCPCSIAFTSQKQLFARFRTALPSCVVHTALIAWDHVLDVDEGIFSATLLKECQGVADQLSQAVILLLPVVNAISQVLVPAFIPGSSSALRRDHRARCG